MTKRVMLTISCLLVVGACSSGDDSATDDGDAPATTVAQQTDDPGDGDGCPYLTDEALTTAMGIEATLAFGDQNGCQWDLADGSQGLLSRWMADYYDENADNPNYLGDVDGITGRWGNTNVLVSIGGEYTLLYTDSTRGTPLREELQAVGRLLAESS